MKPYMLALGLMLAGEAKAEKPKECIDEIVIGITFPRYKGNEEAHYFNNATEQEKVEYLNDLAEHSRDLYTTGLGIDVAFFESNDGNFMQFSKHKKQHPNTLILYALYRKNLGRHLGVAFGRNLIYFTLSRSTYEWLQRKEEEKSLLLDRSTYTTTEMGWIIAHEIGHFFGLENTPDHLRETEGMNVMAGHLVGGWGPMEFSVQDKAKILERVCK